MKRAYIIVRRDWPAGYIIAIRFVVAGGVHSGPGSRARSFVPQPVHVRIVIRRVVVGEEVALADVSLAPQPSAVINYRGNLAIGTIEVIVIVTACSPTHEPPKGVILVRSGGAPVHL